MHDESVARLISQSISLKLYIPYSNHGAHNVAVGAGPSGSDRLSAFHGLPVHFGNPTCIYLHSNSSDYNHLFTRLRVGWPPTPQVYFGPWEGQRVVWNMRLPIGASQAKQFSLFPLVEASQARIFTLPPPVKASQAREFSLFPPVGASQAREFSLFPRGGFPS